VGPCPLTLRGLLDSHPVDTALGELKRMNCSEGGADGGYNASTLVVVTYTAESPYRHDVGLTVREGRLVEGGVEEMEGCKFAVKARAYCESGSVVVNIKSDSGYGRNIAPDERGCDRAPESYGARSVRKTKRDDGDAPK